MEHVNCPSQQPYYIQSDITKAVKGKGKKEKEKGGKEKGKSTLGTRTKQRIAYNI